MIIYNKVLDKRARLAHYPSTYKISWTYRAKCLGIVTLKVLPASFPRYDSEEKNNIPDSESEAKQN